MRKLFSLAILLAIFLVAIAVLSIPVSPYSKPSSENAIGTSCSGSVCHGDANTDIQITIQGLTEVNPNKNYTYIITVNGGEGVYYGFFAQVEDESGNPITDAVNPYQHSSPMNTNQIKINLKTPSAEQKIKLVVAVNSVNGDGSSSGDSWNSKTLTIKITEKNLNEDRVSFNIGIAGIIVVIAVAILFVLRRRIK